MRRLLAALAAACIALLSGPKQLLVEGSMEREPYPLGEPIRKAPDPVPEWAPLPNKPGFWINRKSEIAYGPERPKDVGPQE